MKLIELFEYYIRKQKNLEEYVEERKNIHTEVEFDDETLILAAKKLQKLKGEDPEIYDAMHKTLDEYYKRDEGHYTEYSINFIRQILKMYTNNVEPKRVYECYVQGLDHPCIDAF
jgi:hypothetical protein